MKYLETDLYHDFECIGGECPASCCSAGWKIIIDEKTYEKYQYLEEDTKQWICGNIEECEDGAHMISSDENGRCPFLNENNLCSIILKKSDDYISEVCQTYPRKVTRYNDTMFCTVSASCPEVARQIVERNTQIRFITKEDENPAGELKDQALFQALVMGYTALVEILQCKELLLKEKYLVLLLFVEEIQVAIEQQELEKVEEITQRYGRKKYRKSVVNSLDNIFSAAFDYWNMVSLLLNILMESEVELKEWIYDKVADALNTLDAATYDTWKRKYKKIERIQEKENLAVQFMFEYFMDALNKKSLYNNLSKMYVMMVYIEIFETYVYNQTGELSGDDRIKIISEISRIMEHTYLLDCICDELMEENHTMNLIRLLSCIL